MKFKSNHENDYDLELFKRFDAIDKAYFYARQNKCDKVIRYDLLDDSWDELESYEMESVLLQDY